VDGGGNSPSNIEETLVSQEELNLDIVPLEITEEPTPPQGIRVKMMPPIVKFENERQRAWFMENAVMEEQVPISPSGGQKQNIIPLKDLLRSLKS